TAPSSTFRAFVNFYDGTLFLPDPRPFAPRLEGPDAKPFDRFISSILFRSDSLVGGEGTPDAANAAIYDKRTQLDTDRLYTIETTFAASGSGNEITLGRTNIIEGSEVVQKNGKQLTRGTDYDIDYELGRVTLKSTP